jgi:hypothetical protein
MLGEPSSDVDHSRNPRSLQSVVWGHIAGSIRQGAAARGESLS